MDRENLVSEVVFVGDHHHYEPNSKIIKSFIQTPVLITGPLALHPWLSPILKNRSEKLITINSAIDMKFTEIYQTKNQETLAHFWLYPDIACDILMQYQNKFRKKKISFREMAESKCLEHFSKSLQTIKNAAKNITAPLVLTHDALLPLLSHLGLKVLSLKGSGHHEEISPEAVKALHLQTKNTSVIWIQETGFETPMAIKRLIKNNDRVIQVDANGNMGENVSEVLQKIGNKIVNFAQKE